MRFVPFLFGAAAVAAEAPADTPAAEKHDFQAEVSRLMDIIINSLYAEKNVFLRELISNSADALEKARQMSVLNKDYLGEHPELEVRLEFDRDAKTITISDTGIGMTKAELIGNLGTLAKSGTANFLEAMAAGDSDKALIGQFGVGFYSAFLVADKVSVTSKNNVDPVQHVWESSATSSFTIFPDPSGNTLSRGTSLTLHLKEDAQEYLSESKLKELATKFSQFIAFPIKLRVKKEIEVPDEEAKPEEPKEDEVEVKDEEEEKEKPKTKKVTVFEWEQLNEQKPIWLRSKEDISEEEYNAFYKSISKDYQDPLAHTHFSAEGNVEFRSVLFVPGKAPFDMFDNFWTKKSEVKLYVRRVLVADKFDELLPRYLSFIRGVVDSDDLPLNVSREQLQQSKSLKVISKTLVKKILDLFKRLANTEEEESKDDDNKEELTEEAKTKRAETWKKFYGEFGKNLKMGCYDDDSNRSRIAKLLRFTSLKSPETEISLDEYLKNAGEKQEGIYFISGDDANVIAKSPALQIFKKKDIDVLFLLDHLDEPCFQKLSTYEGKKFISVQKSDVKLEETDEDKKKFTAVKKLFKPLTDWWKSTLKTETETGALKTSGVKIDSVVISKRLVDSPCVVVSGQYGYSAQQEKLMKAQAFQNKDQLSMMTGRKTLEINPNHPVIIDLLEKIKANKEDQKASDTSLVLFQAALLESGYELADSTALIKRIYKLMSIELGVDPEAPLKELDLPENDEKEATTEEGEEDAKPEFDMSDFDFDDFADSKNTKEEEL